MRKLAIYLVAAFILTSCDNLKSKSKTDSDDTEETTTKKKKALKDDEETSEEDETPKKKKKPAVEDEVADDESSNDDNTSDYAKGWSNAEKRQFMDNCVGTAEKNVGYDRAKQYCSCMMDKIEKRYPNSADVSKMTETQRDNWAQECNNE